MVSRKRLLAVLFFSTLSILIFAPNVYGPDYYHYLDWAEAVVSGDIFQIEGDVISPLGVPHSQWSHGTGMLFAVGHVALGGLASVEAGVLIIGWLAALVFWWHMFRLLRHAAKGDPLLTFFGAGATFLGTHAGHYTHYFASETLSYALSALLVVMVVEPPPRWRARDVLLAGIAAGFFIAVRPLNVVYALPVLVVSGVRIIRAERERTVRQALLMALLVLPVVLAAWQVGLTNRWMTGSFTHSPYSFGSGSFRSLDWGHPALLAVLIHPWNGWLSYHPLYAVCFAALVVLFVRTDSRAVRLGCVVVGGAVLANLYVQAAWYVWWLGASFGMRGMSVAAVALMPVLVRVIADGRESSPASYRVWVWLVVAACFWSYLLLLRGKSRFLTYDILLLAQRLKLGELPGYPMAPALVAGAAMTMGYMWNRYSDSDGLLRWVTAVLSTLAVSYFLAYLFARPVGQVVSFATVIGVVTVAALIAGRILRAGRGGAGWEGSIHPVLSWAIIAIYVVTWVLFAGLAIRTERHIASGAPPPRAFAYVSSVPLEEARDSYMEYLMVPGFDDRKAALREFLVSEGVRLE